MLLRAALVGALVQRVRSERGPALARDYAAARRPAAALRLRATSVIEQRRVVYGNIQFLSEPRKALSVTDTTTTARVASPARHLGPP